MVKIKLPSEIMYEGDLLRYAQLLKIPDFRGVKMRDELPNKIYDVECGILNLNIHLQNGSHWTCWYKKGKTCYYFDSFGECPPIEMINYLKTPAQIRMDLPIIHRSAVVVQHDDSDECGSLCLYVLKKLTDGEEFSNILQHLLQRYTSPSTLSVTV